MYLKKKHLGGSAIDSLFKVGEGLVINVSDIKGNVSFDGFRTFSAANARGKDGCKVNGIVYDKSRNGVKKLVVFHLDDGSNVVPEFKFEAVTNHQLRWVELQFSKGRSAPVKETASQRDFTSDTLGSGEALISVGGVRLILQ